MYRCANCNRVLFHPAYTAPESMGGWVLGLGSRHAAPDHCLGPMA